VAAPEKDYEIEGEPSVETTIEPSDITRDGSIARLSASQPHQASQLRQHGVGIEQRTEAELDEAMFRDVMAQVCTPVSVVTAMDGLRPHGSTVSAFASLSADPPMLLVSLARNSQLLSLLTPGSRFCVNVLAREQASLAARFAGKGMEKFTGVQWFPQDGAPRISGTVAWVTCEATELVPGGDHVVVLGGVVAVGASARQPLTYHARTFGTHSPLSSV
jgi:flavin reductase (DIM6/NTAB) family NADH-FMN oxidoreductase RutF